MDEKNKKRKMVSGFEIKKKKHKKHHSYENSRKLQLREANKDEDASIKRLEKLLKINKKKKKKPSSLFQKDGLDYLLDVIDRKEGESLLSDDSLELEEDFATVKSFLSKKQKPEPQHSTRPVPKNRTLTELMKEMSEEKNYSKAPSKSNKKSYQNEEESDEDESDEDEDELDQDEEESDQKEALNQDEEKLDQDEDELDQDDKEPDEDDHGNFAEEKQGDSGKASGKKSKKPKIWEDIYGRLRDEAGNVMKSSETSTQLYVPPKRRKEATVPDEKKKEECLRIKRQLKGLLNRLSESNIQNICNQIEEMFMKYSRNDMNETLFSLMSELLFSPVLTPPRLIMEQAMLIALLHANVGSEIGAYFLQCIVEKLGDLFKNVANYGEGKECNNYLIFLSHLYNFRVTHCTLVFDIFEILIESFQSKDIELIQLFLKSIGFVLRKDDPLKLKKVIVSIQEKGLTFNTENTDSRVKFMLDTLTAIKNNNIYKIPDYDPTIVEHSKKLLKGLVRKGSSIQELAISYKDLLNVEEKGRWWIVGSAWANDDDVDNKNVKVQAESFTLPKSSFSEKILELAKKQHMNTDIRKSIFCIIMTAEDFMDAFEILLKLNLRKQQKREIIHVLLHCVLQEKNFNPYYVYLAKKFCEFAREYKMCLQFSLWDKFKELSNLKSFQVNNLAQFLSHMFISDSLPISVLKIIQFSDMNKIMVRFFRKILLPILLHESEEKCTQVFKRIAAAPNLKMLRESLRLFMHHFILRNKSKFSEDQAIKLEERMKLVESVLNAFKHAFKL